MGYMDVGGVRYFDVRELNKLYFPVSNLSDMALPSDSTQRIDSTALKSKNIPLAQKNKEELEELQRYDRKLREQCDTRREKYGIKFANIY